MLIDVPDTEYVQFYTQGSQEIILCQGFVCLFVKFFLAFIKRIGHKTLLIKKLTARS